MSYWYGEILHISNAYPWVGEWYTYEGEYIFSRTYVPIAISDVSIIHGAFSFPNKPYLVGPCSSSYSG